MEKKSKKDSSILISTWGDYEFKLFPGSKSTKPYVHYQFENPQTGKEERQRVLSGLKPGATVTVLKKYAKEIVEDLIDLLSKGWNPITNNFNGVEITPLTSTVDCMKHWLQERENAFNNKAIGATALKNNRYVIRYFTEWLTAKQYANRKPNTFNYLDINAFMQQYAQLRKWGKVTYNTYRTDLNTFFNYLREKKIIKENPVERSEKKNTTSDASRFKIYEPEELKHVVQLLAADPAFKELYIAAKILFYLNVRPVEITRIQVYNIDNLKKQLWLECTKTKNEKDAKWQLTDELFLMLDEQIANYPKNYYVFGNHNQPKALQAHKDFLGQRWRAFRKKYNLPFHLKLYALKHSSDWYDLKEGVSIQTISERNRHASPTVTIAYVRERLNKNIIQPSVNTKF